MRLEPRSEYMEEDDSEPWVSNFNILPDRFRANFFTQSGLGNFMLEKHFEVELCAHSLKIINYKKLPHPKKWVREREESFNEKN